MRIVRHGSSQCAAFQTQSLDQANRHPPRVPVTFLNDQFGDIPAGIRHHPIVLDFGRNAQRFRQQRTAPPADYPDLFFIPRHLNLDRRRRNRRGGRDFTRWKIRVDCRAELTVLRHQTAILPDFFNLARFQRIDQSHVRQPSRCNSATPRQLEIFRRTEGYHSQGCQRIDPQPYHGAQFRIHMALRGQRRRCQIIADRHAAGRSGRVFRHQPRQRRQIIGRRAGSQHDPAAPAQFFQPFFITGRFVVSQTAAQQVGAKLLAAQAGGMGRQRPVRRRGKFRPGRIVASDDRRIVHHLTQMLASFLGE